MNDNLKLVLNRLQYCIDKDSNYILLIFDTKEEMEKHKKKMEKENLISYAQYSFTTINYIMFNNALDGRRFKEYRFI